MNREYHKDGSDDGNCWRMGDLWLATAKVNEIAKEQLKLENYLVPIGATYSESPNGSATDYEAIFGESTAQLNNTAVIELNQDNTTLKPDGRRFIFYATVWTPMSLMGTARYGKELGPADDAFRYEGRHVCNFSHNQGSFTTVCGFRRCSHGKYRYNCPEGCR